MTTFYDGVYRLADLRRNLEHWSKVNERQDIQARAVKITQPR